MTFSHEAWWLVGIYVKAFGVLAFGVGLLGLDIWGWAFGVGICGVGKWMS